MNEKKICFISCINDQQLYREALYYINQLEVPEGYEIECISIKNAEFMTQGYNKAMKSSDAKYKVYLHQDVYIINKFFIQDILNIFINNAKIGMLGVVGAKIIPSNGTWQESQQKYGKVYDSHTDKMELLQFSEVEKSYESVLNIDGLIMITQYDIPWREDIFDGWCFYDMSQSIEFKKASHEVVIPNQIEPWCIHDCGVVNMGNEYEDYREIFIEEYTKDIIKIFIDDIAKGIFIHYEDAVAWRNYYLEKTGDTSYIKIIDKYLIDKFNIDLDKTNDLFEFDKIKAIQIINSNKKEFFKYLNNAKIALDSKNYEQASKLCFEGAKYASENHPGFYSSLELEEILLECAKNLPNVCNDIKVPKYNGDKRKVLHVLSEGYSTGGHTRLVKNWIQKDKDSIHSLITTWQINSTPEWLVNSVRESGGWTYSLQNSGNFINRASTLRKIAYEWADVIVLHIHMFDPIAVMAFGVEGGHPIIFMNHADHCFWLGTSISDVVLNIRPSAQALTIERRRVENSKVLPIPLCIERENKIKRNIRKDLGISEDTVVLLSVASEYKYTSIAGYSFIETLKKIISKNENTKAIIIGPNNDGKWREAMLSTGNRIIPLGNRKDLDDYYHCADIYLDSFPLNSLTATLNAAINKIPVVGLNVSERNVKMDNISFYENDTYLDNIEDFENRVSYLIDNKLMREKAGKEIFKSVVARHDIEWKKYLDAIYLDLTKKHRVKSNKISLPKNNSGDLFYAYLQKKKELRKDNISNKIKINNLIEKYKEHFKANGTNLDNRRINCYRLLDVKSYCSIYGEKYEVLKPSVVNNMYKPVGVKEKFERTIEVVNPESYIAELGNITVIGGSSTLLTDEGIAINDLFSNPEVYRYDLRSPGVIYVDEQNVISNTKITNKVVDVGILLNGKASYNYFHFLMQILPRLALIDRYEKYDNIPLLVDYKCISIPQFSEVLSLIDQKQRRIIIIEEAEEIHVKNLIVPSNLAWMPIDLKPLQKPKYRDNIFSEEGIKFIRKRLGLFNNNQQKVGNKRIFISRKNTVVRLENQKSVINLLSEYGFEEVYPEDLSFTEQIKLFSNAEIIIGANGAGLTNILFSPENTTIIAFKTEESKFCGYSTIAYVLGLKMYYINGDPVRYDSQKPLSQCNFTINLEKLKQLIIELGILKN